MFCTEWRWFVFWAFDVIRQVLQSLGHLPSFGGASIQQKRLRCKPSTQWVCKRRTFKIDPKRHSHWCSTFVRHPGRRHNFFRWNPFEGTNLWFSMACRSRMVQEDAKAQVQQSSLLSPWYNYDQLRTNPLQGIYVWLWWQFPIGAGFENWYVLWYRIKQGRWQAPQLPPKNDKFARSVDSHAAELLTKHQQQIVTDSAARARSRVLHYSELLTSWFCVRAKLFFVSAISHFCCFLSCTFFWHLGVDVFCIYLSFVCHVSVYFFVILLSCLVFFAARHLRQSLKMSKKVLFESFPYFSSFFGPCFGHFFPALQEDRFTEYVVTKAIFGWKASIGQSHIKYLKSDDMSE